MEKYIIFNKTYDLPITKNVKYKVKKEDKDYYYFLDYKVEKSLENDKYYIGEIITKT